MIKAEVLDALVAAGCTAQQIAAAVKADAEARSPSADRQARYRQRLNLSTDEWAAICTTVRERDAHTCFYCGSTEAPLHIDHVIPLIQGGSNELSNLVTACRECNCSKSGRTPEQWGGR